MSRILKSPLFVALLASLLTASLFGVIEVARAGANTIYTGCLERGELHDVRRGPEPLRPCARRTHQVTWSQRGPQGEPGQQGEQGPPGEPGSASTVLCPSCDLRGANLSGANLPDAYLPGANLTGADLANANLTRADLARADLIGAHLIFAKLPAANLTRADLSNANLTNVILPGVILTGADLTRAVLLGAAGVPLSTGGVVWDNTTCPNGVNSDDNGNTCDGTFSQ